MNQPNQLIDAYLDGELTDQQAQQLRDYVDQSPEQAMAFVRAVCMDQALYDLNVVADEVESFENDDKYTEKRSIVGRVVTALAMAAVLALAAMIWLMQPEPRAAAPEAVVATTVAMLTDSTRAVFADGQAPVMLGGELPPGVLQLESGMVQVMFKSGAVVDLTGPCTFDMTESNRGRLINGVLEAYVPPAARGFTIDVGHTLRVIDLGTRFRLTADNQQVQVQVDEGHVQVLRLGPDGRPVESHTLAAASMASLDDDKLTFGEYVPTQRPRRYMDAVLQDQPAMYWPLNAESGQMAWVDMGPRMLDAAMNGGAGIIADGPLGESAVHFDGSNELAAGSRQRDLITGAPLTVETWLRLGEQTRPASIVLVSPGGRDFGWELGLIGRDEPLRLAFDLFGQHRYRFDQVKLDHDRWMHIAVALDDAGVARLYVDGKLRQSLTGPPPRQGEPNNAVVKIGGWAAGPFFRGDLAHLAIYDHALKVDRMRHHVDSSKSDTADQENH
ncbi:hypothetical protein HED60_13470 [Planctomycetales bacterium ZRK34]|nr:hypothetical protein HED60_13470 [Planctomycetales bacterium ZRK34]